MITQSIITLIVLLISVIRISNKEDDPIMLLLRDNIYSICIFLIGGCIALLFMNFILNTSKYQAIKSIH